MQAEVGPEFALINDLLRRSSGLVDATAGGTLRSKNLTSGEKKELEDNGQPDGRYANYFKVGHNAFEFLLDFGQLYGQMGSAPHHTRIVTTPVYAKTLLGILQESVDQYEQLFGTIPNGNSKSAK